jgi:hypothetical protein
LVGLFVGQLVNYDNTKEDSVGNSQKVHKRKGMGKRKGKGKVVPVHVMKAYWGSGAIPPLPQYAFMTWCSVKAQEQLLPLPFNRD